MLIGREITVLGAGIGGLAVATALAQRGARVRVLEKAAAITEVGAGIQISPNGARVLSALGVGPVGDPSEAVTLMDGTADAPVLRMELPEGFYLVHRADLIGALEAAARAAGVEIELGRAVRSISVDPEQATLHFQSGETETEKLIIGADGLRAASRQAVLGASTPDFTGQVAWRAVTWGTGAPAEARVFMGPKRHLVTYPLRGGAQTNIVAVQERDEWAKEGWSHSDTPSNLRAAFADFGPTVQGLLSDVQNVGIWGLFRHPVAPVWSDGPLALLGDAAHPTLPFLAQGAVMALEDAWVLAVCLAQHDDHRDAFAIYEGMRKPRASRAIATANANGRNYHLGGMKRTVAYGGLRLINRVAPDRMLSRFSWLYDHDVTDGAGVIG